MSALVNPLALMGFNYLLGGGNTDSGTTVVPQSSPSPYGDLDPRMADGMRNNLPPANPPLPPVRPPQDQLTPPQSSGSTQLPDIVTQGAGAGSGNVPMPPPRPASLGGAGGTPGAGAASGASAGAAAAPSLSQGQQTQQPYGTMWGSPIQGFSNHVPGTSTSDDPMSAILGMLGLTSLMGGGSSKSSKPSTVGSSPFNGSDPMSFINQLFGGGGSSSKSSTGSPMDMISQLFGGMK